MASQTSQVFDSMMCYLFCVCFDVDWVDLGEMADVLEVVMRGSIGTVYVAVIPLFL